MSKGITWNSSNVGVSSRWTKAKSRGTTAKAVRKASERSGKYMGGWLVRVEKETSELCTKMGNSPINRQLLPEIEVYRGPPWSQGKRTAAFSAKYSEIPAHPHLSDLHTYASAPTPTFLSTSSPTRTYVHANEMIRGKSNALGKHFRSMVGYGIANTIY